MTFKYKSYFKEVTGRKWLQFAINTHQRAFKLCPNSSTSILSSLGNEIIVSRISLLKCVPPALREAGCPNESLIQTCFLWQRHLQHFEVSVASRGAGLNPKLGLSSLHAPGLSPSSRGQRHAALLALMRVQEQDTSGQVARKITHRRPWESPANKRVSFMSKMPSLLWEAIIAFSWAAVCSSYLCHRKAQRETSSLIHIHVWYLKRTILYCTSQNTWHSC